MSAVRVLLMGRHLPAMDAVTSVVNSTDDLRVVGFATDVESAVEFVSEVPVDVAAGHVEVGEFDFADATRRIRAANPDVRILITADDDRRILDDAIEAGVAGFLDRFSRMHEFLDAVRAIAGGAAIYPADYVTQSAERRESGSHRPLSDREYEVLVALANAKTVDEISRDLALSVHTVRNHVRRTLSKLGARNQLEGVVQGFRLGVLSVRDIEPRDDTD